MSKVRTFSRVYPSYHPRKGERTHFVEKICNSFLSIGHPINEIDELCMDRIGLDDDINQIKYHTIRAGHHFKVGDWFSPRVWSGPPYNSKQIIIAPDIQVKKVWDFDIEPLAGDYLLDGFPIKIDLLRTIALNDGFSELDDFELWFKLKQGEGFLGQIICWNENIEY